MNLVASYEKGDRIKLEDLHSAEAQELCDLLQAVNDDNTHIDAQLLSARAEARANGNYADPKWFSNATIARKIKGRLTQLIQTEINRRNKERKEINAHKHNHLKLKIDSILEAMSLILSRDKKYKILRKAKELRQIKEDKRAVALSQL